MFELGVVSLDELRIRGAAAFFIQALICAVLPLILWFMVSPGTSDKGPGFLTLLSSWVHS